MSKKDGNNGWFKTFLMILLVIAILIGLFYLYLAITK